MAHRHKPRRNKIDRQLITRQQALPDNVLPFPAENSPPDAENLLPKMDDEAVGEVWDRILDRYREAEPFTNAVAEELERAERQFEGLFKDQERFQEPDEDDNRIFMRKTMENMQVVYSHLDSLTNQLRPLIAAVPSISGLYPFEMEFERAKIKELLVNFYLEKNRFKADALQRWRWNFLKHPSAFIRTTYDESTTQPDIRFDVVDRAALYIDPTNVRGDIKHSAWVIEKDWITQEQADEMVRNGFYYVEDEGSTFTKAISQPIDPTVARLTGQNLSQALQRGPEEDDLIERWHYWQAPINGQPHAYGVVLGGEGGMVVRWGPIPYPYKGIPYRGKSYIRDSYRVDGVSLAMQYRSIQEVYNTFLNLRIDDVLENVKRRIFLIGQLFDETTQADHDNDQKYVRLSPSFAQELVSQGRSVKDFMYAPDNGDSTQHLLSDLQYFGVEGKEETSVNDIFRGGNPQAGATLGQVQEQLFRALGVFRPVFAQEMALIEEVAEIVCVYFSDPDFFGPQRIVQIIGPNRYTKAVKGFYSDDSSDMSVRRVTPDEMDVDVTIDVVNRADARASQTMRMSILLGMLDALRHHPELMKEASKQINFPHILLRLIQDTGEDIESITYSQQEQQKNAEKSQAERKQAMEEQMKMLQAEGQAKGITRAIGEKARAESQMAMIPAQQQADIQKVLLEINAKHEATMRELQLQFLNEIRKMREEATLERQNADLSVGHGNNVNA